MFGIKKFLNQRQKGGDSNLEQVISIDNIRRTVTRKSVNFKTILRTYYEISLRKFFDRKKKETFCPEKIARRLVIDIPMQWWIVDIDNGFRKGVEGGNLCF